MKEAAGRIKINKAGTRGSKIVLLPEHPIEPARAAETPADYAT
jgi:hypothetical protein